MNAPERITGVSSSQFSIARYYGGCKAFGKDYMYIRDTDELVRADIFKADKKAKDLYARQQREMSKKQNGEQGSLF